MVADVVREGEVAAIVAFAVTSFGGLDCAFNGAGVSPAATNSSGQKTAELSLTAWSGSVVVNLTGVFLCMKQEIAQMRGAGRLPSLGATTGSGNSTLIKALARAHR